MPVAAARGKRLTQKEAADRLRISTTWLRALTGRGEISRNEDGSYPWPTIADEYEAYRSDAPVNGSESSSSDEYEQARTRKILAEAELRETEAAVQRGDLLPLEEVLDRVRRPLEEVDARLRSAPRVHARAWAKRLGVTQAEAIHLIGELVEEIRADLFRNFEGDDGSAAA